VTSKQVETACNSAAITKRLAMNRDWRVNQMNIVLPLLSRYGYFCRFSKTSFTTGRAENAFGQPA
jgi:hypothetical protein